MRHIGHDLRFAFRLWRRTPGVSAAAILSLALGIGANTTVFTLVNAILLSPLRVRDAERVVVVGTSELRNGAPFQTNASSRLNTEDLRAASISFSGLAITSGMPVSLAGGGEPEQLFGQIVSGAFFDVLGATFAAGRGFLPDEDGTPGAHPVTVLSYGVWQRRFGGDPGMVGQSVTINGLPFVVVGVTAEGFRGATPVGGPDVWVPLAMYRQVLTGIAFEAYNSRRGLTYQAVARLRDGVTLEQAQAEAVAIGNALAEDFPTDNRGRTFSLRPITEAAIPPAFRQQLQLAGAVGLTVVGLVLLIACGNVANLLLARATARRQEIAVRLAVGADRARLLRQLLTESLLLALAGGLVGLVVAYWGRTLVWAARPPFLPANFVSLDLDARVLLFTAAASLATGILFGLAPAIRASRSDLVTELKERTTPSEGARWYQLRNLLIVGQVALSLVALMTAGLFVRSLAHAQRIDLGFPTEGLMVFGLNPGLQGYDEARARDLYRRAIERLRSIPGVRSATVSTAVPLFAGGFARTTFRDDQDISDPRHGRLTQWNQVGDDYFETVGIPILRGRAFTRDDRPGAPPVIIINETMAKQFYPEGEALGRRLHIFNQGPPREIIGIARTIKYNAVGENDTAHMYVPLEQSYASQVTVQVRAAGDAEALLATVLSELRRVEPAMPVLNPNTYRTVVGTALWAPRFGAGVLGIVGLLGLLLAAVGLYGVMSYSVALRRREIGIRLALGAGARTVRLMILRQGLWMAGAGIVVGLAASLALARFITSLLFGVDGIDVWTAGGVTALLLVVAAAAAALPARRASRVDPVVALRL